MNDKHRVKEGLRRLGDRRLQWKPLPKHLAKARRRGRRALARNLEEEMAKIAGVAKAQVTVSPDGKITAQVQAVTPAAMLTIDIPPPSQLETLQKGHVNAMIDRAMEGIKTVEYEIKRRGQ